MICPPAGTLRRSFSLLNSLTLEKAGPQKGITTYAGTIFPDSPKVLFNALLENVDQLVLDLIFDQSLFGVLFFVWLLVCRFIVCIVSN